MHLSGRCCPLPTLRSSPCAGVPKAAGTRWLPRSGKSPSVVPSFSALLTLASLVRHARPRRVCASLPATKTGQDLIPLSATDPSSLGLGSAAVRGFHIPAVLSPTPAPGTAHAWRPQTPGSRRSAQTDGAALCLCVHVAGLPPSLLPRLRFSQPLSCPCIPFSQHTQSPGSCASRLFPELEYSALSAKSLVSRAEPQAPTALPRLLPFPGLAALTVASCPA